MKFHNWRRYTYRTKRPACHYNISLLLSQEETTAAALVMEVSKSEAILTWPFQLFGNRRYHFLCHTVDRPLQFFKAKVAKEMLGRLVDWITRLTILVSSIFTFSPNKAQRLKCKDFNYGSRMVSVLSNNWNTISVLTKRRYSQHWSGGQLLLNLHLLTFPVQVATWLRSVTC